MDSDREQAGDLLGVKLTEPKRSETLKQYMSNMDYTDKDIIHEDENEIYFGSRPDRDEFGQNHYDKKTDTYNTSFNPSSAVKFNDDYKKRVGIHNSYLSNLKNDIRDEEECVYHYNKFLLDYADGIMKRSKNNIDSERALEMAKSRIGTFRDFKKSVLARNNRK